ncbi:single-stranded DNA-binding protein [Corynebacterium sp.]|uniref:single-stranded DNA-binding protein n=1 Tax=Corynebacterium sp. TaxID=1720 RepID=UPI0025BBE5EC|nr:single-stranded DNA-binding protein [Corynebacterium sp.]
MATQQMSVTMTGFAASNPVRNSSIMKLVTFRMASTPRWNTNGEWKDGGTLFIDVQCWGRLGDHVMSSVVRGAPLVIAGRMTSYSFKSENGQKRADGEPFTETLWRVTASNVGLDLSHSPSTWSLRDKVKDAADGDAKNPAPGESTGGFATGLSELSGPAAGPTSGLGDAQDARPTAEPGVLGTPTIPTRRRTRATGSGSCPPSAMKPRSDRRSSKYPGRNPVNC